MARKYPTLGKNKRIEQKKMYHHYINSEDWAERKNRYYSKYKKECACCKSVENVHLHHRTYKRLGNEFDMDLVPLCEEHHKGVHDLCKSMKKDLWQGTKKYISWYKKGKGIFANKAKQK